MRAKEFLTERKVPPIKDQILAAVKKDGGNIDDYFVRFTMTDKLGFSNKQWFPKTLDVDDPNFSVDYIGHKGGKRSLWFYPLKTYLEDTHLYAKEQPYVWLVKKKPNAWLQTVDRGDNKLENPPPGKERVGMIRMSEPPAAIFFQPAYTLIGKYYDYAGRHKRHGLVKGPPPPTKSQPKTFFQKIKDKIFTEAPLPPDWDPEEYQGIIMSMVEGEDGFKLTAKNSDGQKLGFVEFSYDTDGTLRAEELEVNEKYRGKGIAKIMYDYVKNQGFKIAKSSEQTPSGLAFWNKHRPGKRIWEQGVAEAPLPPDWDPEKVNLRQTYKDRIKYVVDRAKRIGGGSSRVAVTIEHEGRPTVLKVAKNYKGLAQNEAEIGILDDGYLSKLPIVIPLIDYDKENSRPVWLQTEIAKKVTTPTLMKLLHTPSLWLFNNKVRNILGRRKPHEIDDATIKRKYFETYNERWKPTEQDWDIFEEYANEVADLVGNSSLELGDLNSASNWGVYNGRPVIIDLGLSSEVWQKYYIQGKYRKNK